MKVNKSIVTAGILMAALVAASPMALAQKSMEGHEGRQDKKEMCDDFRDGKGKFSKEERQQKMQERRAEMQKQREEMANRLKLTDEQRVIWSEIHDERQKQHQERMEKHRKDMEKRCGKAK
ncbi:hypothetical protein [Marinobacter sp.]|uniref:hypothetical protein n=1 Tax=Marinobacter sp. TaxID=50741 RepID=UPI003565D1D9